MRKMFVITLLLIAAITLFFLLFSSDMDIKNRRFLASFGIKTDLKALSQEEFLIPEEFDKVLQNYNIIQLEAGFDLNDYKNSRAVRYTYKMLNFPKSEKENIYADVICVKNRQVGGDICCTDIDGFMLPLNFLENNSFNQAPVMKYQIPAKNDAPMP